MWLLSYSFYKSILPNNQAISPSSNQSQPMKFLHMTFMAMSLLYMGCSDSPSTVAEATAPDSTNQGMPAEYITMAWVGLFLGRSYPGIYHVYIPFGK